MSFRVKLSPNPDYPVKVESHVECLLGQIGLYKRFWETPMVTHISAGSTSSNDYLEEKYVKDGFVSCDWSMFKPLTLLVWQLGPYSNTKCSLVMPINSTFPISPMKLS